MTARHAMVRPIPSALPAGLGCLWVAAALSQAPTQAAGVLLPGQPSGFGSGLPGQPSGFGSALPGQPSGYAATLPAENAGSNLGGFLLEGLNLSANFSSTYNSNLSPTENTATSTAKDDFILGLGGTLNYMSKASDFTFGGNYHGNYNQYFNHPDYSGYSQGGALVANYNGGRWTASGTLGLSIERGNNTNYASAFVEQLSVNTSLTASYRLSPKTSLQGTFSQNFTSATGSYSNTSSMSFGVSALWRYSPLTEFGPGVRYTSESGSTQTGRTSIGPTFNVNYKLSQKVALNSQVGMNFSSYANGASANPTISASIGLNYQASRLWGMDLSLFRDTQADPMTAGAYTETTSLRVGYHHKILRAMWNLGANYQTNTSAIPGSSSGGNAGQNSMSFDTSLSMLTFANTTSASVFLRFSDQGGGTTASWNSVQTGISLSRSF